MQGGRRLLGIVLGVALAALTGCVVLRWVDAASMPVAVIQALFPVVVAATILVATTALVCRYRRLALVGAVPAVTGLALAGASLVPHTAQLGPGQVTVLSTNIQFGQGSAEDVVAAVRAHHADVAVVLEIDEPAALRLRNAGLERELPYSAGSPNTGASGSVIRSRWPVTLLDAGVGETGSVLALDQPVARVEMPGKSFTIKAVHPLPPVGYAGRWRESLRLTTTWKDAEPPGTPLVLAGDFNGSEAHPAYREISAGMTDTHRAAGAGWVRTWPQGRRMPPFVQLDHVLVRGFDVVDAGTTAIGNTDHAAVWATLRTTG